MSETVFEDPPPGARLEVLPEGPYLARLVGGLDGPPGGSHTFVVTLEGGLAIAGVVTDPGGRLVEGVPVTARHTGQRFSRDGRTDANGAFRIGGLVPGTYAVATEEMAHVELLRREPVLAEAGEDGVRIECVRTSLVSIRCLDAATGLPVDAAIRYAFTEPRGPSGTAEGGVFGILPPGPAKLDIEAEGYLPVRGFAVEVTDGGGSVETSLRLTPDPESWALLDLVVTDETGGPVPEFCWRRFTAERREESASGRYALRLVAGTHDLSLWTPRDRVERLEPSWLGQTLSVKLDRGGRAVERVRMRRGGILRVRCGDRSDVEVVRDGEAVSLTRHPREDGFVTLLEPGRYEVGGTAVDVKAHEVAEVWLKGD